MRPTPSRPDRCVATRPILVWLRAPQSLQLCFQFGNTARLLIGATRLLGKKALLFLDAPGLLTYGRQQHALPVVDAQQRALWAE